MPREEFGETKVVIRVRTSINNRKHNGLQNITHTTNKWVKLGAPEGFAVHSPLVVPFLLLKLQTQSLVMDEERTGKCLRQVEHIREYL